ncbi:N-acetylneuraminate synthase family protein [Oceanibacterium hippocampi]|uniref:Spore coat polysaccharide biosynthesis protein SpsE n=1 Tax=Oceanibacterium hippocampi TaxID=745714 RepID=A0A1Y5SEA4_9PROT|nr:N-acetylneuraminate synthase family protein [Oceanibacterium hippocampi]SLN38369.1 Spore coat polysaccharide biosynthesis protein SpsE [Oceanibacterium hippocampi]
MPATFIAEVSSNHARDLDRCFEFVDVSAAIGCDAVKFQLFRLDEMFAPEILERSAKHRARRDWELPEDYLAPLAARCREKGIAFSCTPFHLAAVRALEPHVAFYKIASYELPWDGLLAAVAATGKPVVLSTGMATMAEIHHAVDVLRTGGATEVTLLHTVSAYPTPPEEANLAAIDTIRAATGCAVGWSDHTVRPGVVHRAIGRHGATMIEFHLDLDGKGAEFAAGHCWLPDQIAAVIAEVRAGEAAEGNGEKVPTAAELPDRDWRADPEDGLRPFRKIRARWTPDP